MASGSFQRAGLLKADPKACAKIVELRTIHKISIRLIAERYAVGATTIGLILKSNMREMINGKVTESESPT